MSDQKNSRNESDSEEGTRTAGSGTKNFNIPAVVLSGPSGQGDDIRRGRSRKRSVGPSLTLNTNLDPFTTSRSKSRDANNEDRSNLSADHDEAASPSSSFFSKLSTATSIESKIRRRSISSRRLSALVPYLNSPSHSRHNGSVETFHSTNRSPLMDNTDTSIIDRGLKVALGDNEHPFGGLWLPLSPERKHGSSSDIEYPTDYEDEADIRQSALYDTDSDSVEQEGIRLQDLNLNVPSYPEYLATTTTPAVPSIDEPNVTFERDIESQLRIPTTPIMQPNSPRHQISSALKKFSARVNGRDADEDEELLAKNSMMSFSENESDLEEGYATNQSILESAGGEEGSSETNNETSEIIDYKKDATPLIGNTSELDESEDNISIATKRPDGFEEIKMRETEVIKEKERIRLFGNSLKYFAPDNSVRLFCSSIVFKSWFEIVVTVLTFIQTALLSYEQWNPKKTGYYARGSYTIIDWLLFCIYVFHTIEIAMKVITYGLIDDSQMFKELKIPRKRDSIWKDYVVYNYKRFRSRRLFKDRQKHIDPRFGQFDADGKFIEKRPKPNHSVTAYDLEDVIDYSNVPFTRAYLRGSWNRIDFVSIGSFWISFLLSINHYDLRHSILLFRSLMCLRILRLTNFTHGTSVILKALKKASPDLLNIALFLVCFWVFFAIIGVQSFKSSLRRNCVWFNPTDSSDYYVNTDQYCGSYLDPTTLKAMPYVLNDGTSGGQIKGFRCPVNSKCVSNQNPYSNSVSFDNIANSFEMVFVVMSANTFTDIMYDTMNTDSMAASLFYIFGIFFLTVWIVNLLVAVIVNAFKITRDEALSQRKKNKQKTTFVNLRSKVLYNDFKKNSKSLRIYHKFEPLYLLLICVSLSFLCMRTYNAGEYRLAMIYKVQGSITVLLLVEIIVRFCCFFPQWRIFFHSKANIFDLGIAIITSIILLPPVYHNLGRGYDWLCVFEIARWYRVVLSIGFVKHTWFSVLGHVQTIFDLSLFYFIFLYLTSIIMSRFFEGTVPHQDLDDNPFAMYSLMNSFISLYVITSTENWSATLYTLQEYAKNKSQQFFGAAYLIVWFIFSNMIVLNIFIAVISENLSVPESQKRKEQIVQYLEQLKEDLNESNEKGILAGFKERLLQQKGGIGNDSKQQILYLLLSGKVKGFTDADMNKTLDQNTQQVPKAKRANIREFIYNVPYLGILIQQVGISYNKVRRNPFVKNSDRVRLTRLSDPHHDLGNVFKDMMDEDKALSEKKAEFLKENPTFNTVFYILPPNHKLRRFCQRIVPSSYGDRIDGVSPHKSISFAFSFVMFMVTAAMVIVACYATPLYKKKHTTLDTWDWLTDVDLICTLLFSLEFFIKLIADGLIYTPNAYLISSWNHIDAIVLATLWINLILTLRGSGSLSSVINGFKALRALRLLTLSTKAKSTFQNTVIAGFRQILSAGTISLTLLYPFTIWGLNLLSGRLGSCLDGVSDEADCFGEFKNQVFKWDIVSPNTFVEPYLYFNTFKNAFLSLFEIISLEGWVDLLENAMNSTGVGTAPSLFATPSNAIFVVMFNFISTIFILTLFVSVIIQNYSKKTGRAYQTTEQAHWYEVEKILKQMKASRRGSIENYSRLQLFCHKMIVQRNRYWMMAVNFFFGLHTLALLLEVYPSISALDRSRYVIYMITSYVFVMHLFLTIIAQGPRNFFSSNWNLFTVVVVVGAFATSVISFFVSRETAFANINKLFLVGILLLLIPRIDRLEQLSRYAIASLPSLVSLLYTWGILFLVYAIALNQIFGLTRIGPNTSNNINTRTVTKTLILLFRMSFGEGWNYIMDDFAVLTPYCYNGGDLYNDDCGNMTYAYLLFISWNIVSMFIFLNIFVSLIVDSFSYVYHGSDPHARITRAERRKFKAKWLEFDPDGTGFMDPADLEKFLGSLSGALSYKIYNDGRFTIPELKKLWFQKVDDDPYSVFVDYPAMNSSLNQIDPVKVNIRRLKYERLVEEILMDMRVNNYPGVSFTSVILKVAMYAHFEENRCLTLNDFMIRYISMDKVDTALKHKKVYNTLRTAVARWRYKKGQYEQLMRSNDVPSFQLYNDDGNASKAPLIFISEYLRSEDDIQQDPSAESSLQVKNRQDKNNNVIYDDAPFINPFSDSVGNPFETPITEKHEMDLHFRPQDSEVKDRFGNRLTKEWNRKLTGSGMGNSSALSEAPIIKVEPPANPFKSRNSSKDSLYSVSPHVFARDAEVESLLSVDLSSPRR